MREITVAEPGETPRELGEVDVVFPLLHGPWGEDGTIQGLFEIAGIRYVGSGVLASAVGMDKHYMKIVLAGAGLPVTPYVVDLAARVGDATRWRCASRCRRSATRSSSSRPAAARAWASPRSQTPTSWTPRSSTRASSTRRCSSRSSAEGAREVECGVLERLDGGADASVVAEITGYGEHEFYDFAAKYLGEEGVTLEVPADLPHGDRSTADPATVGAGIRGAWTAKGWRGSTSSSADDGRLTINEINTMPGFTPASMYPRMWAESGVAYPELVDRLISLALQRSTGLR